MKILLDENIHRKIQHEFGENYNVFSVRQLKWNGKKNGELMTLCVDSGFDILVTLDKNLQFQQNLKKYNLKIILLKVKNNRFITVKNLVPKILLLIDSGLKEQLNIIS